MTQHVPGMPAEAYDQTTAQVGDTLRGAPGFISHAGVVDADGVTVTELWETREQWQTYFDEHVKPHLPPDLPEPSFTELRAGFGR